MIINNDDHPHVKAKLNALFVDNNGKKRRKKSGERSLREEGKLEEATSFSSFRFVW